MFRWSNNYGTQRAAVLGVVSEAQVQPWSGCRLTLMRKRAGSDQKKPAALGFSRYRKMNGRQRGLTYKIVFWPNSSSCLPTHSRALPNSVQVCSVPSDLPLSVNHWCFRPTVNSEESGPIRVTISPNKTHSSRIIRCASALNRSTREWSRIPLRARS